MKKANEGFSLIEIIVALIICLLGVALSVAITNNISRFSSKQRALDVVMTLESYINEALLNSANYQSSLASYKLGHPPSSQDFFVSIDSSRQIKIGEINTSGPTKNYFDDNKTPCTPGTNPHCVYYTELSWDSAVEPFKIKFSVSYVDIQKKIKLSSSPQSVTLPSALYTEATLLKCPQDGEKYLGIKNFNTATGAVDCWRFDKSINCPKNSYPIGLQLKNATSSDLVVQCKPILEFKCPEGYAPFKAYPFDLNSLAGACISIKIETIPIRIGHISTSVKNNQPPNPNNFYGLKWVTGKLCPDGYKITAKTNSALALSTYLKDVFIINDSENKVACPSVQASCGLENENVFCDACPKSDPTRMQGCNLRPFTNTATSSVDPTCRDPKIFDVNNSGINNLTQNYECRLDSSLKFADGIVSEGSPP